MFLLYHIMNGDTTMTREIIKSTIVTVRLPEKLVKQMDDKINKDRLAVQNRTHCVEQALTQFLNKEVKA